MRLLKDHFISLFLWPLRLIILASLPGMLLALFLLLSQYQKQSFDANQQLLTTTQRIAHTVNQEFGRHSRVLTMLAKSPSLSSGDWKSFYIEATAALENDPTWRIWVFDLSGQRIIDVNQPLGSTVTAVSIPHEIVNTVVATYRPIACNLVVSSPNSNTPEQIISACTVARSDSKITYILAVVVDLTRIAEVLAPYPISSGKATLVDNGGQIIGSSAPGVGAIGGPIQPSIMAGLTNSNGGILTGADPANPGARLAYYPVGDTGWIVTYELGSTGSMIVASDAHSRNSILGFALAFAALVLIYHHARSQTGAFTILTDLSKRQAIGGRTVTDRLTAIATHLEAQMGYRLMAENSADVITVNSLDGIRLDVSPSCKALLGYERDEMIGRPVNEIVHPNHLLLLDGLASRLSDETYVKNAIQLLKKDKSYIWVETLMRTFRSPKSGEIIGFVSTIRDITERKAAEERAERATMLAEAANRAKSDFLASMSHELRTPLNAILGFSQLLLNNAQMPLSERQKEYVEYVIRGGNQLLALINDLLDFVKTEAGTLRVSLEKIDLSNVVAEAAMTLNPLATHKNISVGIDTDNLQGRWVHADRSRLLQVLINLGSNAIKYNRLGGEISISIKSHRPGWLNIAVKDTGFGIPDNLWSEVFEPFNRLGAEGGPIEGTGIGLTISQRLMSMMGGYIDFTSVPGEGSIFWIELPEFKDSEAQIIASDLSVSV